MMAEVGEDIVFLFVCARIDRAEFARVPIRRPGCRVRGDRRAAHPVAVAVELSFKLMDTYDFTPSEREFFSARLNEVTTQQLVLRNAVSLVCGQQSLQGTWRIRDDVSGLERMLEPASLAAAPEAPGVLKKPRPVPQH
jgi:hypothetical protein